MNKLYLDTETYSEVPIKHGTYKYTENCECMILTYAINDGPVEVVDFTRGGAVPEVLHDAQNGGLEVIAHSSMFDRNVIKTALGVNIPIEYWYDTLVQALAHGLPGGLDKLCDILKVENAKHKDGRELIQLFCKPRTATSKIRRATHATHPEEWKRFIEYAKSDIAAMREIHKKLPTWNYSGRELALWHLDQRINDRGMQIDLDLVQAALRAVDLEKGRLAEKTREATAGQVQSATQRDRLLGHILEAFGVSLPDLQSDTLERRLADDNIPDSLKELLRIRLMSTTTSTSKYSALSRGVNFDGRLRGTLQFDGAARTRRAAGRTFQPQNLPSRGLIPPELVDGAIDVIKAGCEDLFYDNTMQVASSLIRGCIIPAQGNKLVVSDLANIEGRVQAWFAGEEWKLQAFRDYDEGTGPDLYKVAYARAFNIDTDDVSKSQRQIGKVKELMLGYEGGVGAYLTGAATYGIDLEQMSEVAYPNIPSGVYSEAVRYWNYCIKEKRPTYGLTQKVFCVCDSLKRLWRYAHPAISSQWGELKDAAIKATLHPGVTVTCRRFKIRRDGEWLRIGMPSGRCLCYPSPRVDDKGVLSYMGVNTYTKKWSRIATYGGKLFENACQSLARDILYDTTPDVEAAGYKIILMVHDEDVTEVPDSPEFSADKLSSIIATAPSWAEGLPLAAAGFESYRYRKD